jgi:hypothetical protein
MQTRTTTNTNKRFFLLFRLFVDPSAADIVRQANALEKKTKELLKHLEDFDITHDQSTTTTTSEQSTPSSTTTTLLIDEKSQGVTSHSTRKKATYKGRKEKSDSRENLLSPTLSEDDSHSIDDQKEDESEFTEGKWF